MIINPYLLSSFALLLAFPLGIWLARVTRYEVQQGKKYLKILFALALIGLFISLIFFSFYELIFFFSFVVIIVGMSLMKARR